jgi:hypothetical protein
LPIVAHEREPLAGDADLLLPARMTMQSPPPLGFLVDIDAVAHLSRR